MSSFAKFLADRVESYIALRRSLGDRIDLSLTENTVVTYSQAP
jgi:hypothetical protein